MHADFDHLPEPPPVLARLRSFLLSGLENPCRLRGSVSWTVESTPKEEPWQLSIALDSLAVSPWQRGLKCHGEAAKLQMSMEVAELLAREIHTADYRDPRIMKCTRFSGDLTLLTHVAKALVVPGSENLARLDWATQRDAPAYSATKIDRVHQPSEQEILGRIADGQPFVATGISPPSAHGVWTLERLRERYSDVLLRVRSADWQETVGQFVDRVQAHMRGDVSVPLIEGFTKAYTEGSTLPGAMRADFMPHRFTLDDYIEPQIWLGAVPVDVPASSLHRDPLDGFLFQLMGRKKLVLYSPDQAPLLYPMKAWNNYQPCWVAPENPRLDVFPDFARARPLEVVLHPGELLIQPAGWFHAVYCLDSPTFSVSYFLRH